MTSVFLVTHAYELRGEEQIKIIGVYKSKKDARLAVRRKKRMEGFRDHPKGFHIDCLELGKDQWSEGFFTYSYVSKTKKKPPEPSRPFGPPGSS